MILFFNKKTGDIIGTIDGRVHDEAQQKMLIDNGIGKENIGKYIIGWTIENKKKVPHHMEKFELLKRFEDNTPENALKYKVIKGDLKKKLDK